MKTWIADSVCAFRISVIVRIFVLWNVVFNTAVHVSEVGAMQSLHSSGDEGVVEGGTASLSCFYKPVVSKFGFGGLYWRFASSDNLTETTDIASFTQQGGITYNAAWSTRLTLNASWNYGGILTLSNVTLADSGRYECQISTMNGYSEGEMLLNVYKIPKIVTIRNGEAENDYDDGALLEVIEGQRHVIVCSASPPSKPATNLTWELDSQVETLSSTSRILSSSRVSSNAMQLFSSEIRVTILPREDDHRARIACHGNHPGLRRTLNTTVILAVRVPPNYVRIWDSKHNFNYLNGSTFIVQEGRPITLSCIGSRSRPPANIKWRIGDDVINDNITSYHVRYQSSDNLFDTWSQVTLSRASREDHGKIVTCWASDTDAEVSINVILDVEGPPDPPDITIVRAELVERRQHSLQCTANNGYPAPDLLWYIDDNLIAATSSKTEFEWRYNVSSKLLLTPSRRMNGKRVNCTAVPSREATASAYSYQLVDSTQLRVMFCPISVRMTCDSAVERKLGKVSCETSLGNPAPHVTWTINGLPASSRAAASVNTTLNHRTIEGIQGVSALSEYSMLFDAGDDGLTARCCVARSQTIGCTRDVCDSCQMSVHYKPILEDRSKGLVLSINNRTVTLHCVARGNPTPTIQWYSPWMSEDFELDEATPGIVTLETRVMESHDYQNSRDVIESTLVIDRTESTGLSTNGAKCLAVNSIGDSFMAQHFGGVLGLKVFYSDKNGRGKLTIEYHITPGARNLSPKGNVPAMQPCAFVDYLAHGVNTWHRGDGTCFNLTRDSNLTVIWVASGLDPSSLGVRLCYFKDYCTEIIHPQAEYPEASDNVSHSTAVYCVFGVVAFLVAVVLIVLFIIKVNRVIFKVRYKPNNIQQTYIRNSRGLPRQSVSISAPVAGQRISAIHGRDVNQYTVDPDPNGPSVIPTDYHDRIYETPSSASLSPTNISDTWQYIPAVKPRQGDASPASDDDRVYENIDDEAHATCKPLPNGGCTLYMAMSAPTSPRDQNLEDTPFCFDGVTAPTRSRSARASTNTLSASAAGNITPSALQEAFNLTGLDHSNPLRATPPTSADKGEDCLGVFTYGPILSNSSQGIPVSPASVTSGASDDGYFSISDSRPKDPDVTLRKLVHGRPDDTTVPR